MAIQDDNTVLCKGDLKAYHEQILPYLGGNLMLGTNVSDYYSTDEKIVGVWLDGKPIYQKTLVGITAPVCQTDGTSVQKDIDLNYLNIDVFVGEVSNCMVPYNESYSSSIILPAISGNNHLFLWYKPNTGKIRINNSATNYNGAPIRITIQYTKTTDAANSAVTTPGCYDINRPDLWPANQEIFFGNGLYGQKFTGTKTIAGSDYNENADFSLTYSEIIKANGFVTWSNGYSFNIPNYGSYSATGYQYAGLVYYGDEIYLTLYGPAGSTKYTLYLLYKK